VKLPRDASGAAAVAALERLGFVRTRQTGSHELTRDHLRVTVPMHRPIAPGTLKSILRQAQLEVETFVREIR
jgi:predicted RNA binding protein YcfA (HicA-like mRNA interferase family)